jgi:uncharacterized protein YecE (DUF72 family)
MDQPIIRLGTSTFTAAGWVGSFSPKGLPAKEQLIFHAQHFDAVEVDSMFYRKPSKTTVQDWSNKTLTTNEMFRPVWNAARRPDRSPTSKAVSCNLFK